MNFFAQIGKVFLIVMIPFSSSKKDLRVRQAILRGVYEENLRIIGRRRVALDRPRPFFLKKLFLSLMLTLIAVLIHGNRLTSSSVPELAGFSLLPQKTLQHPFQDPAAPSDYKSLISNPDYPVSRIFGLGIKTIMIDPGHGGADSGTSGKMGTKEKDITLDIAQRLKTRLEKHGRFTVLLTRDRDATVPLNRRVEMAIANKADLFISIHLNYLPARPINIIETYYFGPTTDEKALKLAEQENAGSQYGPSDFKKIIANIGDTLKLQESRTFASSIQKTLYQNIRREVGNVYDFGVKRAPFVVLLGVNVPSVLAEVSCLSNREEEMKLHTESHRENIAHYLEAGIFDYINKGEARYEPSRLAEKR